MRTLFTYRHRLEVLLVSALLLASLGCPPRPAPPGTEAVTPPAATTAESGATPAALTLGTEGVCPLPGGGEMRVRYVPRGAFAMGNSGAGDDAALGTDEEKPKHQVTVGGFWMGEREVTRGQYRKFMQAGGYTKKDYWSAPGWAWVKEVARTQPDDWAEDAEWAGTPGPFKQTDEHPVVGVNYYEAEAFCRWAGLRLPTEAEWEKAARWDGHGTRAYAWGDTWDDDRCNGANDKLYPGGQTAPVGKYPEGASACGSLDMLGNVWEWTQDWYLPDYYATSPGTDPKGPATGEGHVIKGGSWFGSNFVGADDKDRLRPAQRAAFDPQNSNGGIGFRCAITTLPVTTAAPKH